MSANYPADQGHAAIAEWWALSADPRNGGAEAQLATAHALLAIHEELVAARRERETP